MAGREGDMSGSINLEIWFLQQDEVTVFLESSYFDEDDPEEDDERFHETALFALFAARQIANFRNDQVAQSLSAALMSLDEANPLGDLEARLAGDLLVRSPARNDGGRKGFTAELRPDKRGAFKLYPRGFGLLGRGVAYYAPTSTLALLCWLLRRRPDDALYQRALGATARFIGYAGSQGMLTARSQVRVAMQVFAGAWSQAMDEDADGVDADVLAVAQEHGIDFNALRERVSVQLDQLVEEIDPEAGKQVVLPEWLTWGLCRTEVWMAVDLGEDDKRVERAYKAKQAAEATGDEEAIGYTRAHFERVLTQVIEANGLTPIVAALHREFFSPEPD
jgi:hypothetical protein